MYWLQVIALAAISVASPVPRDSASGFLLEAYDIFPLANGFPDPDSTNFTAIEVQAHGNLPNNTLPTSISNKTAAVFSLIATNELFEVAFFTDLLRNITTRQAGYEFVDKELFDSLVAIQAQEELHALGANGILKAAGRPTIQPCRYTFPVSTLHEAVKFAAAFTDLVLGALQTALTTLGTDGDAEFLQLIGSVIGNEGEQEGFFRSNTGRIAIEHPFLTVGGAVFAFSALSQNVIVPGSCPILLSIPALSPLALSRPKIGDQILHFSFPGNTSDGLSLVYLNEQSKPIVQGITGSSYANGTVYFDATFDQRSQNLNGFTLAAVVHGSGPFDNASTVASAAIAGPALIQVL